VTPRLAREAGFDPVVVALLARTGEFDIGGPIASRQFTSAEMQRGLGRP
jgi:hypothetical protein